MVATRIILPVMMESDHLFSPLDPSGLGNLLAKLCPLQVCSGRSVAATPKGRGYTTRPVRHQKCDGWEPKLKRDQPSAAQRTAYAK